MPSSSFVNRQLQVTIKLAQGTNTSQPTSFVGTDNNTIVLPQLRMSARINFVSNQQYQNATLAVWGLDQALMNQLQTLGIRYRALPFNNILIQAGNATDGFINVFNGDILQAWADYEAAPDVAIHFDCQVGAGFNVLPASGMSFTGSTDVAQVMQTLANKMGLILENNGVSGVMLKNPVFNGSLLQQMQDAAEHANITANIFDGKLIIAPQGKGRTEANVPKLIIAPPPLGQMIGYPAPTPEGVMVRTIFDPRLKPLMDIELHSSILQTQVFNVRRLDHALDTQLPHGQWMSTMWAYSASALQPVVTPALLGH